MNRLLKQYEVRTFDKAGHLFQTFRVQRTSQKAIKDYVKSIIWGQVCYAEAYYDSRLIAKHPAHYGGARPGTGRPLKDPKEGKRINRYFTLPMSVIKILAQVDNASQYVADAVKEKWERDNPQPQEDNAPQVN